LPGEAGKPGHLKEGGVTPTEGDWLKSNRNSAAIGAQFKNAHPKTP